MKFILLLFFVAISLYADTNHNINGLFGEKAAGLGGAYTAVSDDPSGAYYNPAGLAFAYDNSISLSASNITKTQKNYVNVLGPGQSYVRDSQNYIPNFFGIVKEFKKYKIAFSIVNTLNESFSRNDQVTNPIYYPRVRSLRTYNLESYNQVQSGFSVARSITDRISVGATLYYTFDTASINNSFILQSADRSFQSATQSDTRTTIGFLPILGIMYMPTEKLSFGVSVRRQLVTSENRLTNAFSTSSFTDSDSILFQEGTHSANGGRVGNTLVFLPKLNGRIPEVTETRVGFALFPTKQFMFAFDVIQTSGYTRKQTQFDFIFAGGSSNVLRLYDPEVQELQRNATTNFAGGIEYYLNDNFAIRLGSFTNNANNKQISWLDSAIQAANREASSTETIARTQNGQIQYTPGFLRDPVRNEYVNLMGGSIGFSWSTSKASLGLTIVKERGKGQAQIDATRPIQQLTYDSTAIYVIVSSKSN
jgi:long-chain fatty acid transport protein